MVKLEDAVIARLSSIAVDKVFKDSKKGDAVSESEFELVYGQPRDKCQGVLQHLRVGI